MPEETKNKRKYTSPHTRAEESIAFRLQERDIEIIKAVNRCKYLQTGDVHKLLFPDCSKRRAQTRLTVLYHNGYLGRVIPFAAPGNGSSETAYYLDQAGRELLELYGIEPLFYPTAGKITHHNLLHALDLSAFRVYLELALRDHPKAELKTFIADFEMKGKTDKAINPNRYKLYRLYEEIIHPTTGEPLTVYPDAAIVFKGKGKFENFEELYFLEIDRGTEGLQVIQKKVVGYHYYRQQNVFRKFGERFKAFTVLIQTSNPKRAENMRKAIVDVNGADLVWITDVSKVNGHSIIKLPIWQDYQGRMQAIIAE